jgi:hypothetical protein
MKKAYEATKKQLDLMATFAFPTDEDGDVDTDLANEIILKSAQSVVEVIGEDYAVSIADLEEAAIGFGDVGQAVIEAAAEFNSKTITHVINALLFEVATKGLHQGQFVGALNLHSVLAEVVVAIAVVKNPNRFELGGQVISALAIRRMTQGGDE